MIPARDSVCAQAPANVLLRRRGSNSIRRPHETMTKSPDGSLHKHIRVSREQWERLERAAQGTPWSPNQILAEFAMEALDRC